MIDALCIDDVARLAARALPKPVADFVNGGSGRETALTDNVDALASVRVVQRVLRDVTSPQTRCRLFGYDASMPVVVAPMAYQRLVHPDGERASARAAHAAGIPYTAATLSSYTLEEIAGTGVTAWFQLYWLRDRSVVRELVRRAEDADYRALVLTVDTPRMGRRLRDVRNALRLPDTIDAVNLPSGESRSAQVVAPHDSALAAHTRLSFDAALSWSDVDWLRSVATIPLLLKGVVDPDDAVRAVACGVDGLVVSNHGGRQLDAAISSVQAIRLVRAAVGDAYPLFLDGGVRGGEDVLKALACGAIAVFLGRPVLWGLAAGGHEGVSRVLDLIRDELELAMALAGCPDLAAARALKTVQAWQVAR